MSEGALNGVMHRAGEKGREDRLPAPCLSPSTCQGTMEAEMTDDRVLVTKLSTVHVALNLLWTEHFTQHYQDPVDAATEYARKIGERLKSPPISDLSVFETAALRDEMGVFFGLVVARLRSGSEGLDS